VALLRALRGEAAAHAWDWIAQRRALVGTAGVHGWRVYTSPQAEFEALAWLTTQIAA
jgi:hypothetical protein